VILIQLSFNLLTKERGKSGRCRDRETEREIQRETGEKERKRGRGEIERE
jgi:hypothetical protein